MEEEKEEEELVEQHSCGQPVGEAGGDGRAERRNDNNTMICNWRLLPSCGRNFLQKAHCFTLIPSMILKVR